MAIGTDHRNHCRLRRSRSTCSSQDTNVSAGTAHHQGVPSFVGGVDVLFLLSEFGNFDSTHKLTIHSLLHTFSLFNAHNPEHNACYASFFVVVLVVPEEE